jgi:hypothetical protein
LYPTHAPKPPRHVGQPLEVGELALLRLHGTWSDLVVEIRAID